MYLNDLKLIGYIGADAETKQTSDKKQFVRFDLATQTSWKNSSGEYERRTHWHKVVVWGNLVKLATGLKKGEHVYLAGELRYREYNKEVGNGANVVTIAVPVAEVHAETIRRLDAKADTDESPAA